MGPVFSSVVIPTWNRRTLVGEAIESTLDQAGVEVEVIVVDDGSTDGTAEMLVDRFGSRIVLVRLASRQGPARARNAGLERASGEWIGFLDSDDLWLPGKSAAEQRVLREFPTAEAIVSDSIVSLEQVQDQETWLTKNGLLAATQGQSRWLDECPWVWGHWRKSVATCAVTVRRESFESLDQPYFLDDLQQGEDWEFKMRLFHQLRVVVLPEALTHVRRFDDGTRPGRSTPGRNGTREQERRLTEDSLAVVNLALERKGIPPAVVRELETSRQELLERLGHSRPRQAARNGSRPESQDALPPPGLSAEVSGRKHT